jgi:glycerophosphoryl diester phosphodiesterase
MDKVISCKYLVHRANTISSIYKSLYTEPEINAFEIDVQADQNGEIYVFHDDITTTSTPLPQDTPTLDEFLRFIPDDVLLNIEIKVYDDDNCHVGTIVSKVLDTCRKYSKAQYIYSTFHKEAFDILQEMGLEKCSWLLVDTLEKYEKQKTFTRHICIDRSLYNKITWNMHDAVVIYNCTREHSASMPLASAFIVDP